MTSREFIDLLQKQFPAFGKKVICDVTAKGEEFFELIYPNNNLPAYPLALTVFEDGALISFGNLQNITGGKRLSFDETLQAISDVIEDRIVFTLCYQNAEDKADGKISDRRVFLLTEDADDMSEEYENLIEQIKKPIGRWPRFLTPLKGIFVFMNFSGSVNFELTR